MSEFEIVKHIPKLATGIGAVGAAFNISKIGQMMLGPAAGELAEMWKSEVRTYRFGRELACLKKAEKMTADAGFSPRAVPIKLLFPLLECASLEENDDLHTMWAALLANASIGLSAVVRPCFISTLKEMAPDEAELLVEISKDHTRSKPSTLRIYPGEGIKDHKIRFTVCVCALEARMLIKSIPRNDFRFTEMGYAFVQAVTPPKSKV